jgi:PD-(D/E)XK nuclease superfamily
MTEPEAGGAQRPPTLLGAHEGRVPAEPQLDIWHVSALTALLRCGEQYRRRYIERERIPPTTPLLRGTAVHRGVNAGLLEQRRAQEPAPVDLYEDVAASEIERARHGGATFTAEEHSAGVATTWGRLTDRVVRYAGGYGRRVAPGVSPVTVERRVTVRGLLPGALLRGTLDLVDAADAVETIVDTKTTERAPQADAADRSLQLTMYSLLRTAERGADGRPQPRSDAQIEPPAPDPVALDYLVLTPKTNQFTYTRLRSSRTARDRGALVRRIEMAARAVRAGVFMPADPQTDWWCSEKWCEYATTCVYFIGRRASPGEV